MSASFPHQYYSHYTDDHISNNLLGSGIVEDDQEHSQMLSNNADLNMVPCVSSCHHEMINSPVSVVSFAEQFGLADCNITIPASGYYDIEPASWQAYNADNWVNIRIKSH